MKDHSTPRAPRDARSPGHYVRVRRWYVVVLLVAGIYGCNQQAPPAAPPPAAPAIVAAQFISYAEARPVVEAHRGDLPGALKGKTPGEIEGAWASWTAAHDASIRARLTRGDEDSVINFWLYGTTFTAQPRATLADLARRGPAKAEDLLVARLHDLVEALANPGSNERLRFAKQVIERHGVDVGTAAGKDRARELLVGLRERMIAEARQHDHDASLAAQQRTAGLDAFATIYKERGLSSDTSLAVNFALDRALAEAARRRLFAPGDIRRVAIVGPGLDFTDKAEGYDLYPVQTIQPFALADSLMRHGLSREGALSLVTFDLSPRVNEHLRGASGRGRAGEPYVLQMPLTRDDPAHSWEPALVAYWKGCGAAIGDAAAPVKMPETAGRVDLRAVRVRPGVAAAIRAEDLNVIVQRLAPLGDSDRFDLIIATNVLVYYDRFEQALALANMAAMLRPGGIFVTNYQVHPAPPLESTPSFVMPVFWDRQKNGDTMLGYRYVESARRQ